MESLPEPAIPASYTRTTGGNAAFHNFNNDYMHIQDPNLRRRLALSEVSGRVGVGEVRSLRNLTDTMHRLTKFPLDGEWCALIRFSSLLGGLEREG